MSININVNYKNPDHIKRERKQDNKGEPFKTVKGESIMAKHVHMSLIMTYKLYHHCIRGYINNVVMSIFIGSVRF
jgi:hypothetical protein